MRLLVLSDIHANLAAFEAVMEDAAGAWDKVWCLGDVVGYGPDPNECAQLLQRHEAVSLSGNHDWAVLGKLDKMTFNTEARKAIDWTRAELTDETRAYLEGLPAIMVRAPFTLAHASPRQPVWEYILDDRTAAANFAHFDTDYCLVGHTHTPVIFEEGDKRRAQVHAPAYFEGHCLGESRLIINPGSVGQPRDSDSRAAYGILDTDHMTFEHRRVEYPIAHTQAKMRDLDFPQRLVARLEYGW